MGRVEGRMMMMRVRASVRISDRVMIGYVAEIKV